MDGANQRFMAQRAGFLRDNIIFYNVGHSALANPLGQALVAPGTGGELPIGEFDLRPMGQVAHQTKGTRNGYVLHQMTDMTGAAKNKARRIGFGTHRIRAYLLAWGSMSSYEGTLGDNADFFFTPTVNGCSFAASNGVAPRVVHSNHANVATQKIDQAQIDADLTQIFGAAGPDITLKKADYKGRAATGASDYMATIIGFRDPHANTWRFYYQRYKQGLVHKPGIGSVLEPTVLQTRRGIH